MEHYRCQKCGMNLSKHSFYISNDVKKYPNGRLSICKKCLTQYVNPEDITSAEPIFQMIDVPMIPAEWKICDTPLKSVSKYLAKMRLMGFRDLRYHDTKRIEEEKRMRKERFNGAKKAMLL